MIRTTELRSVSLRLAAALLIQDGQLSIREIKALPFVGTQGEALSIAQELYDALSERYDLNLEDGKRLVISGVASKAKVASAR